MCVKQRKYDHKSYAIKYINQYFGLKCSAEMQELRLFPNLKEIQESFSIINNVQNYCMKTDTNIDFKNPNINVYVIGDGVTPRTAAVFNFLTKWKTFSIDPLMRIENDYSTIQNLNVFKGKAEDVFVDNPDIVEQKDYIFIILPHSHIENTNSIYRYFKNQKTWIINLPCCKPNQDNTLPIESWIGIKDRYINSDKNILKIYNNYLDIL